MKKEIYTPKRCSQCNLTKDINEFYNDRSQEDGKQRKCKDCSKLNNKRFKEKNPYYWWGDVDSYFSKNYTKTLNYIREYVRAKDKDMIVYTVETPEGLFIGSTRRKLVLLKTGLKVDLRNSHKGITKNHTLVRLNKVLLNYSLEEGLKMIEDLTVVVGATGTFDAQMENKKRLIKLLENKDVKILNKKHTNK